ncbi:indole-3-glycerol phosphate synthase TrpC [Entomobacter blattae]|uniref:Indole-3-glycerol phosphate synthase n=1 Tax=Entomobacter blattae TaxID=2762277 RepID=A0A7H1NSF8_9PROT|nr:indole-3-glycerol phosphate synthase TrpC [Entomobacter blattae]QNT78718.1 Indole-3-glycerol phosphate synthase [Entomobacter blattae]
MNEKPTLNIQTNIVGPSDDEVPDILLQICARVRSDLAKKSQITPLKEMAAKAGDVKTPSRGFAAALKEKTAKHQIGLIAETKKASPSAGLLCSHYNPALIAQEYQKAGAACISVLTEGSSFGGSVEDLIKVKEACSLPVLRKDFILDPWQVHESRLVGADCILLIMAVLKDEEVQALAELAGALGMDVLIEVHNEQELNRALVFDTALVGINNRNLSTLEIDIATTEKLAPQVPPDKIIVSESGIKTHEDVVRLQKVGASGFLVGESLLKQKDRGAAVAALLGKAE